ncbi:MULTISPECIES: hypothetical protein [unclassified Ensifer]|uniref:hypothetical protein n=1 Tax=unclassified Ensifer TaxID=2633371 RepID=UPI00081378A5|nr:MULTISPECIES: hypothetical protein [unclassified Ensifer]OCP21898.1 hypothetical protein BC361_25350 [Ensifer sp. LC54]OCP23322.1 hypothetical protein BC363_25415 [Ensifer sp. LC384]
MPSNTENVKLGVCTALFDSADLGFTKGGVEVEVQTNTHEVTVDQMGETPIDEIITGRTVQVTIPMAETTLENLARVMPGSTLVTDGAKATGTVVFSTAAPVNGDKITIDGLDFTFKTAPSGSRDMAIPATIGAAAIALAAAINNASLGILATPNAATVNLEASNRGVSGNVAITKTVVTAANVTVTGMAGGVDATKAKVVVETGTNISLLKLAKKLVLRPKGAVDARDDFTIFKAMTSGAIQFAYQTDQERIFNVVFKGYADASGRLFAVGDETAAA